MEELIGNTLVILSLRILDSYNSNAYMHNAYMHNAFPKIMSFNEQNTLTKMDYLR